MQRMPIHTQGETMSATRIMFSAIKLRICRMSDISRTFAAGRQIISNAHTNTMAWAMNAKAKRTPSEIFNQKRSEVDLV